MQTYHSPLFFVLSAALYGAIPVAYVLSGEGEAARSAAIAALLVSGIPVLLLGFRPFRTLLIRSATDLALLGLAALNSATLLGALLLMFLALEGGEAGMAAVLVEAWPVFQVWMLALLMRDRSGLGPFRTAALGFGGMLGVIYLSHDGQSVPLLPVLLGLGSAFLMAFSASTKALAVLRLRDRHGADPLLATFVLKLLGLPAALVIALPQMSFEGVGGSGLGAALLVAALSFSSSLAATLGTYTMRDVSAFLLFLLTPVFGLIFLGLIGEVKLGPSGPFGVVILLALNALALLPRSAPRSA